ncbi:MAG TPA: 3-oxoadipate CoA-transferase, partial [Acinetobacter radioresistens]|nr:3-oxoadipate CoA-transferase [Acinetobacter radioresistens]
MINKIFNSAKDIVIDIQDGSIIAIGGFGGSGMPNQLIDALIEQGAKALTIV